MYPISRTNFFVPVADAGFGNDSKLLWRITNGEEENNKFLFTVPRHWPSQCCCELISLLYSSDLNIANMYCIYYPLYGYHIFKMNFYLYFLHDINRDDNDLVGLIMVESSYTIWRHIFLLSHFRFSCPHARTIVLPLSMKKSFNHDLV